MTKGSSGKCSGRWGRSQKTRFNSITNPRPYHCGHPQISWRASASLDKQFVCAGSTYATDGDGCRVRGDDWVAVYGFGTWSPESSMSQNDRDHVMQFSYTAPMTNKLLSRRPSRSS